MATVSCTTTKLNVMQMMTLIIKNYESEQKTIITR